MKETTNKIKRPLFYGERYLQIIFPMKSFFKSKITKNSINSIQKATILKNEEGILNGQFSKEGIRFINGHMKRGPTSLITKGMDTKATI